MELMDGINALKQLCTGVINNVLANMHMVIRVAIICYETSMHYSTRNC